MGKSIAMNGGEGPNSYTHNSKQQRKGSDRAKVLLSNSIQEKLITVENKLNTANQQVFRIADLGCSVGPNTFACVQTIIEATELTFKTQVLEYKPPEFQVFFNDHVGNDFNTLFKALPLDRQYMAAGVPGSFHGRLFPKASMNFMHSSFALHWLTKVPKEVTEESSSAWNKGSISYVGSSSEVVKAYTEQFVRDMEGFFRARAAELTSHGLMAILMPCRPEGTLPSESIIMQVFEVLGCALTDMAKEGLVSEALVDSFNLPIFIPTGNEVKEVLSNIEHLTIEKSEEINYPPNLSNLEDVRSCIGHRSGVVEAARIKINEVITNHFDIKTLSSTSPKPDLGCSTGPNTFIAVQNIIEALELLYRSRSRSRGLDTDQIPEFQVFFNDHSSNDFNTLFKSLPPNRQYFACSWGAGFFPWPLAGLDCKGLEVMDESSPAWDKGRIHYTNAPKHVGEAYATRFAKDVESFLSARSQELVAGGLLALFLPAIPDVLSNSDTVIGTELDLGSCLMDVAKEGLVSEAKVDSFNLPLYYPSLEELKELIGRNEHFSIERMENLNNPKKHVILPKPSMRSSYMRAKLEGEFVKQFGNEIMDELFNRYCEKVAGSSFFLYPETYKYITLFVLLKRKD